MKGVSLKPRHLAVLLLALLCGCVHLERSYPDKHYFVLEVGGIGQPANQPGKGILEVSEVRVSPRYADPNFVYRLSETSYESDFYNQFLIAPAALATEEIRKALARSGIFEYVISPSDQLPSTFRLQGIINALYGDFRNSHGASAVVEIEFFLTRQASNPNEIAIAKRYSKSVPLTARSPEALVKGWDEALGAVLTSFIADLKSANLQPSNCCPTGPAGPDIDKSGGEETR
jgi:ABC-type uncharacterized transport system auxiliary subunit